MTVIPTGARSAQLALELKVNLTTVTFTPIKYAACVCSRCRQERLLTIPVEQTPAEVEGRTGKSTPEYLFYKSFRMQQVKGKQRHS